MVRGLVAATTPLLALRRPTVSLRLRRSRLRVAAAARFHTEDQLPLPRLLRISRVVRARPRRVVDRLLMQQAQGVLCPQLLQPVLVLVLVLPRRRPSSIRQRTTAARRHPGARRLLRLLTTGALRPRIRTSTALGLRLITSRIIRLLNIITIIIIIHMGAPRRLPPRRRRRTKPRTSWRSKPSSRPLLRGAGSRRTTTYKKKWGGISGVVGLETRQLSVLCFAVPSFQ